VIKYQLLEKLCGSVSLALVDLSNFSANDVFYVVCVVFLFSLIYYYYSFKGQL